MAERDEKGRFVPGNSGGGRKPRAVEDDFLSLIDTAVSNADWLEIIKRALIQAKRGDATARAWLTDRRYGKAAQVNEITGADGSSLVIRIIDEAAGG